MRPLLLAVAAWLLGVSIAAASPTVSNHNTLAAPGATTVTASVTASAGDVVIVCALVRGTTSTVPTLSISGGSLSWATRQTVSNTPLTGNGNGLGNRLSCFSALTAGSLSAVTMTVTSNVTIGNAVGGWLSVSGTSATQFDTNLAIPTSGAYANATTATTPTVTVTTGLANDLLYAINGTTQAISCGVGVTYGGAAQTSGFNQASSAGLKDVCINFSWKSVSATQTSASVAATGTGSSLTDWSMIADALTSDTPSTGRSRLIQ